MYIKKIFAVASAAALLATGCSKIEDSSFSSSQASSSAEAVTEEATEVLSKEKNPLTGEYGYNEAVVGKRPVAVMINNLKAALPQYGIDEADIIYELPVEGGITRLMGVYADYTNVPYICSVRSCRYYYPLLAYGMDAIYCHWGTDKTIALDTLNYLDIDRFDGNEASLGYGTVFVRDEEREMSYDSEHTGALDGSALADAVEDMGYRTDINEENESGAFIFNSPDSPVEPEGAVCMTAELAFSQDYYSTFEYDSESETYLKYHSGSEHCDGISGNQLEFTNVFALESYITTRDDGKLMDVDLSGGDGYYISMGKAQPITWEKESDDSPLKFYDENGAEISVNAGKSYIGFIDGDKIDLE
ncbi:MAG: DUF3048 domain-containing protein [Porcipelethomonas sp.]